MDNLSIGVAYEILLFIAIIVNSSLILILSHRSERNSPIISFIFFLTLINVWAIPDLLNSYFAFPGAVYETLNKVSSLGYVFIPGIFLIFALTFTMQQRVLRQFLLWFFIIVPTFTFLFLSWNTNLLDVHDYTQKKVVPWGFESPVGEHFSIFLLWFASIMLLSVAIILQEYRATTDVLRKKQVLLIVIAILIPLIAGLITDGILPLVNIFTFPTAVPLTTIMAIIIVIAIFRYGLFEVTPLGILSSINEGIVTVDNEGFIMEINNFAGKVLNIDNKTIHGEKIDNVLTLYDKAGRRIGLEKKLLPGILQKEKKIISETFLIKTEKKQPDPYALAISPLYSGRSVIGATIIFRNIKKEKEREKTKDDFISMISHELKTPITSIKAYNQLLLQRVQKGEKNGNQKQLVVKMDEQVERLNRLLANFLEVSRMQSGRIKLEKEFFKVNDLIQNIIDDISIANKGRKIVFQNKLDIFIYADKARIEQVVINLLNNAIKYSPKEKRIIVSMNASKDAVTVSVKDYGEGILPEHRRKIFEQFYQINQHTQRGNQGLGMGLYIAANVVRHHNGKIWVESTKGRGSTFSFQLPIR